MAILAPKSVRDLWEVRVAQRRARASIVTACEAAVEHGLPVQIVILTHEARERSVQRALALVASYDFMAKPSVVIRIEE